MSSLCMVIHIRSIHQGNLMKTRFCIASVLFATLSTAAVAQSVDVKDAWARSTVQGQKATGAFMKLTAKDGAKLVGASSPAAGVVEVHEMKMEGDVMKMRAIPGGLDLPAGKAVELKPGGYHVMLMDLKAPLAKDTTVPLTLVFKDAKGVESKVELKVPVSTTPPGGAMQMDHSQHKM
jgi:copper(I)-binding protein